MEGVPAHGRDGNWVNFNSPSNPNQSRILIKVELKPVNFQAQYKITNN